MFWPFSKNHLLTRQRVKRRIRNPTARRRIFYTLIGSLSVVVSGFLFFSLYLRYEPHYAQQWDQQIWPHNSDTQNTYSSMINSPKNSFGHNFTQSNLLPSTKLHTARTLPKEDPWRISIVDKKGQAPSHTISQSIIAATTNRLNHGSRDELQRLSHYILRESVFDHVSITRTAPKHVLIRVNIPEAVAIIEAGSWRLLSKHGGVLGKIAPKDQPHLPRISGVFSPEAKPYTITSSNKLSIRQDQARIITRILTTLALMKETGLSIESLNYDPYLGISLSLSSQVHIGLGHPPYNTKIRRLASIIQQAKKNGSAIKKIELDFQGKAFVQLYKDPPNES
ncbi:MAG: cell division protein FtsQ/DivIB [Proteobacteria bacterium]|nr:cell division protein FtsQ/DivIB [Pseudomonadota bacterium]